MSQSKIWTLTDVPAEVWLPTWAIDSQTLRLPTPQPWFISKRTLHGGLRDGVELIEVHNGALSFAVVPTRGMGLWRGDFRGMPLGWASPARGPVHPKFVDPGDRDGLGWLQGFDELMCRCGLSSNGPPGPDEPGRPPLTLHGRIANLPAYHVEVRVGLEWPHELSVVGRVEEASLFGPNLHLTTTLTTAPGSNRLVVHDDVENRSAQPAELQMLYHCNVGPPLLEAGSRLFAPAREVAPLTARAAEGIETLETYACPTPGFAEQVYAYDLAADHRGRTAVLLTDAAAGRGLALRFSREELPWFVVWKNTGAVADGYVTGLEPATNLPNHKSFERKQGRVVVLPPGGRWQAQWSLEAFDTRDGVERVLEEIAALQVTTPRTVHRTPQPRFSPGA